MAARKSPSRKSPANGRKNRTRKTEKRSSDKTPARKKMAKKASRKTAGKQKSTARTPSTGAARANPTQPVNSRPRADGRPPHPSNHEQTEVKTRDILVVGIGASAGGLEALRELFGAMPTDTGMAFVVVTHHHPGHTTMLPELLSKDTEMQVVEIHDGMELEPNRVYVATGKPISVENNILRESTSDTGRTPMLPIDFFFRSLAEDRKHLAVCIVLSGTGTDGSLGLKAIKGEGGMAMVQEAHSARYAGMPSSAIATAQADYIVPVAKIPERLVAYGDNLVATKTVPDSGKATKERNGAMQDVFRMVRARTGHDFSAYKASTLLRRIDRRLNVHRLKKVQDYVRLLKNNPQEISILFKEFLIGVTSFFRNPQAFESLTGGALRDLLSIRPEGSGFRAWVVGCGTGEEAYTVAILVHETAKQLDKRFDFQVFATGLDHDAIEFARTGRYPAGIANDVPPDKLERYFDKEDSMYRIRKEIRDMVIFAPQNVISDPPFTKLDFIACRNVLIYMNTALQNRLLPLFHYALKLDGLLMLGPSETIGTFGELFDTLDKKNKIYRRRETAVTVLPELTIHNRKHELFRGYGERHQLHPEKHPRQLGDAAQRTLLDRYVPAAVIVSPQNEVLFVHGRTAPYLEPAPGEPPWNVLDMARKGLRDRLATALREAAVENSEVVRHGIRVKTNGGQVTVDLSVMRLKEPQSLAGSTLIIFRSSPPEAGPEEKVKDAEGDDSRVSDLERELQYTKESLQTTVEELETSNEELKSTNEELQSTNEELQSTNEELETSKEEMQSLNEELTTVNTELQSKVEELAEANNDMQNLLNSTNIATVFLDDRLCIKRYTRKAKDVINLIDTDIGRPIGDLAAKLEEDIESKARHVLDSLDNMEAELQSRDGRWYLMRMMPYRTTENLIDGVVITFVGIDRLKADEEMHRMSADFYETIIDAMRDPVLVLNEDLNVVTANDRFYRTFKLGPKAVENRKVYDIGRGQWNIPELRSMLETVLPEDNVFEDYELEADFGKAGRLKLILNGRKMDVHQGDEVEAMVLLAMQDVTQKP
jgi:two-component system CheB/CheR fusion protein